MKTKTKTKEKFDFMAWCEFTDKTCDAILVRLNKNVIYDYPIPSPHDLGQFLESATRQVCGEKPPKYIDNGGYISKDNLKDKRKIRPRVLDGLIRVVNCSRDENSKLHNRLFSNNWMFGHEWFFMKGDFFRWRPGEKEEAMEGVEQYFTKSELACFDKIMDLVKVDIDKIKEKWKD